MQPEMDSPSAGATFHLQGGETWLLTSQGSEEFGKLSTPFQWKEQSPEERWSKAIYFLNLNPHNSNTDFREI